MPEVKPTDPKPSDLKTVESSHPGTHAQATPAGAGGTSETDKLKTHDPKSSAANLTVGDLQALISTSVASALLKSRHIASSGAHVNSGPPGFANEGGHANFDPGSRLGSTVSQQALNQGLARAGSHVNSGPPGFANEGGHANFDPGSRFGTTVSQQAFNQGLARAGSHVNSGPPGFANEGGHANFDPGSRFGSAAAQPVNVTLPDGSRISLPASGPINLSVGGIKITR